MARAVDDLIGEMEQRVATLRVGSYDLRWEPSENTPILDQWLQLFRYSSSIDGIFHPIFDIGDRILSCANSDPESIERENLCRALQVALYNIDVWYRPAESKHDVDLEIHADHLIERRQVKFVLIRANRDAHDRDFVEVIVDLRERTPPAYTVEIVIDLPNKRHYLSGTFHGREFTKGKFEKYLI